MAQANQADFLGEGTLDPVLRPKVTQEELDRAREARRLRNEAMGLDANGNPLPAYGTPASRGGTASGYQVTSQPRVGTGAMSVTSATPLGSQDAPLVGGTVREYTTQTSGTNPGIRSATTGTVAPGAGGQTGAQSAQGAQAIQDDIARREQASQDALTIAQQNNVNPSQGTGRAVDRASSALGPAPQVEMGLADRQLGAYQEALGMSREVIDRLLNGPSTAERLGQKTLTTQLALARSARGGPGAVQQALSQAQQQAPELQAQATQQAVSEELGRTQAAGNVASNFAQAALGARGQDIGIAQANQDAGLRTTQMISQLAGTQLELDQRNQELLGQLARDIAATGFDYAKLDAETASRELDRLMQMYGIDKQYAAQIKALEMAGKITSKDIFNGFMGIVGGLAGIGAAAAGA